MHGGPSLKGDPKTHPCGFCDSESACIEDTAKRRLYECKACGAIEHISKGASWWYFGWEHPDGRRLRSPTTAEMNGGKYGWQADDPRPASLSFSRLN